ncbi:MAG: two-component regulator propeller domain-containing protein [Candidatus Hatepunaea meridiana]|nr:two-component regulator propeller domain-containing protein [Candidatus Hatepunaea meridiana]
MNKQRISRSGKLTIVILTGLLLIFSNANAEQWRVFNDMHEVRDVVFTNGMVWCATNGGLAGFHPDDEYFNTYTNIDGFDGTGLNRLAIDSSGGIWIAVNNRILQRFCPETRQITHTVSAVREISIINDIAIGSNGIYAATNIGIGKIKFFPDQDRYYWFERYTHLGTFPDQETVNAVVIQGDNIWAATSQGVARGDLNSPAPLTWQNYTTADGLIGNNFTDLAVYEDRVFAASDSGVFEWDTVSASWAQFRIDKSASRLECSNNILRVVTPDGIYIEDLNTPQQDSFKERNWVTSIVGDDAGRTWMGLLHNDSEVGGIAMLEGDSWSGYQPNSPSTNIANAMAFAPNGDLLMVGGRMGGEYGLNRWDGGWWRSWAKPAFEESIFGFPNKSIAVDLNGGVWVGTFGGGIAWFMFDDNGALDSIAAYNYSEATGRRLIGYSNSRLYNVLTPAVAADAEGNIWVVNRGADNGNVLVCIPRDFIQNPDTSQWHYFHRSQFNNYPNLDLIAIDGNGRKWLASTSTSGMGRGVYAFDDNGTPGDTTDDQSWGPIPGLNQPEARCLAWDPDGYIWAGTIDGAYYVYTNVPNPASQGFTYLYHTRNEPINAITIDPAGNKWLGTNHGIMIIAPDLFTVVDQITTDPPSMLPDSVITTLAINPENGWAYIGTNNGTASLRTPYRDFGATIESVSVEPNPFNPNSGVGRMFFIEGLSNNASVCIYTPDGRLVRKLNNQEAGQGWDGLNDDGKAVANGVFLILTYNGKNQAGQGKVAVVWK